MCNTEEYVQMQKQKTITDIFFTCGNKPNDFFLLWKTKTYFLFLGKTKPDIFSLAESN